MSRGSSQHESHGSVCNLTEQVYHLVQSQQLIPADSLVLAAVSGGADSLALLLLLADLRDRLPFTLQGLHVHHGLRGQEADEDEVCVRDWCLRLSVPFHARAIDVAQIARTRKIGIELAARQARHAAYRAVAEQLAAASGRQVRLALAHHMDDQAETVLMNLGRGSGLDGLAGMSVDDGFLIRPLLRSRRRAIEQYLAARTVTWRHDRTNDDDFTVRNRLRHQVVPVWAKALSHDPVPMLNRAAENLALDRHYLMQQARAAWDGCKQGDTVTIAGLLALHPALQARVIRLFWEDQTGNKQNLDQVHIHTICTWLPRAVGGQGLDLPGKRRLILNLGRLSLQDRQPASNDQAGCCSSEETETIMLSLPGITRSDQLKVQVTAEFIENDQEIVYNGAVECFWLDRIRSCRLRSRLPGDRIHPWGRSGGRPLKKYLQEQRIPPDARADLFLLACGSEVIWLPGYASGAAHIARPGVPGDGRRVCLSLSPLRPE